jgi:serine/threonine protein kinase
MKDRDHPFFLVKIGDLGVAKLLDTSTAFAQTIVGTPYYLSPELCADQPYRDKSDCWALGVLLYEVHLGLSHPAESVTLSVLTSIIRPTENIKHIIIFWYLILHLTDTTQQCCTLRHPFEARNQCALIMKIIQTPVKSPASESVSDELSELILWLLAKDPAKRSSTRDILNEVLNPFYRETLMALHYFMFHNC